jgi:NAD-dependent deacetylase
MTEKKVKVVFFTGAGISAESGLKTFRDSNGLWENYKIEDVATPEAWNKNKEMVLQFYNLRRKQAMEAFPNKAHKIIAELENLYDVHIITQNVDDLHERAGSKNVLHLHGELMKSRSTYDQNLVYTLKNWELNIGDICEKGSQLRPHIVWFGEAVPEMDAAISIVFEANVLVVIGTSLNVYPAAGIAQATNQNCIKYLIDPSLFTIDQAIEFKQINKTATEGIDLLADELKKCILKF